MKSKPKLIEGESDDGKGTVPARELVADILGGRVLRKLRPFRN